MWETLLAAFVGGLIATGGKLFDHWSTSNRERQKYLLGPVGERRATALEDADGILIRLAGYGHSHLDALSPEDHKRLQAACVYLPRTHAEAILEQLASYVGWQYVNDEVVTAAITSIRDTLALDYIQGATEALRRPRHVLSRRKPQPAAGAR